MLFLILAYALPIDSPLMDGIEYLQLKGLADIVSMKPYEAEWVTGQIDRLLIDEIRLDATDRTVITRFSPLLGKNPDFSYLFHVIGVYEGDPTYYGGALDERFGGVFIPHVKFSHAMRIQRANALDPLGPKPWNEFQTYLNEGLVRLEHERLRLDLGRREIQWGPGDAHGLLLSSTGKSFDGFVLTIPGTYLEFSSMFSPVDPARPKFLSLHRLGLNLRGFLKIGFSEAILSADSLEPLYINPFLPFYLAQWSTDRDDNAMWSFDVQVRLFNSIAYAELLIDDFMYEDDPFPDKVAYQVGVKSLLLNRFVAKINYTFVDKWVYTQRLSQNVYERDGVCLGFPLGNDVDELSFSLKYVNRSGIFPHASLDLVRKGEGSIYVPYEEEGGPIDPPFPSGVVERTLELRFGADYAFRNVVHLRIDLGRRSVTNAGHVDGNDTDNFIIDLSCWAIL